MDTVIKEKENIRFLRYRGSKLGKVKQLDIFPKVEETFKQKSSVGGTCKSNILINILPTLKYKNNLF